jgi:Holliday junction resolvase-like predicted endonuclease
VKISKSSRHSKITGDFAEGLVLYWLSKHGFECASVDHTGIDLIARNPHTAELMGISVKARSRNPGTEGTGLRIPKEDLPKLEAACKAFSCAPYFAIVVDAADLIRVWIMDRPRFLQLSKRKTNQHIYWRMGKRQVAAYETDPSIITFEFSSRTRNWWPERRRRGSR